MRSARGQVLIWLPGAAAALGPVGAGWAAFAPLPQGPRELLYVIPKGMAGRQAVGEALAVLPSRIRLTIGVQDVLVLRNDDVVAQSVGPARLEAGQTYRLPMRAPIEFALACSAHKEGKITIVARAAPAPGWGRLRWRLEGLFGG
jgi:hypothetical protein